MQAAGDPCASPSRWMRTLEKSGAEGRTHEGGGSRAAAPRRRPAGPPAGRRSRRRRLRAVRAVRLGLAFDRRLVELLVQGRVGGGLARRAVAFLALQRRGRDGDAAQRHRPGGRAPSRASASPRPPRDPLRSPGGRRPLRPSGRRTASSSRSPPSPQAAHLAWIVAPAPPRRVRRARPSAGAARPPPPGPRRARRCVRRRSSLAQAAQARSTTGSADSPAREPVSRGTGAAASADSAVGSANHGLLAAQRGQVGRGRGGRRRAPAHRPPPDGRGGRETGASTGRPARSRPAGVAAQATDLIGRQHVALDPPPPVGERGDVAVRHEHLAERPPAGTGDCARLDIIARNGIEVGECRGCSGSRIFGLCSLNPAQHLPPVRGAAGPGCRRAPAPHCRRRVLREAPIGRAEPLAWAYSSAVRIRPPSI